MSIDTKTRTTSQEKICKFFKKKVSKIIEESIYKFSNEYATYNETPFLLEQIYNTKLEELLGQFKISETLVKKIKNNEFDPTTVAFLRVDQLHPEKYDNILKKRELEEVKKANMATTSAYKCKQCGSRKAKVDEKQTRAGDEPATVFITCTVCGNEWRL